MSHPRREPSLRAQRTRLEERLNDLYERAESLLTSVVALFLTVLVVVALLAVIWDIRDPIFAEHDLTTATLKGIDSTFLAIILLELLHTTLSRGPISQQLQEFLVIGITATVRHGLGVAAGRGDPRDVVINLAIDAVGVFVLVAALWLVRQQLRTDARAPRQPAEGEAAAPSPAADVHVPTAASTDRPPERSPRA